MTNATPKELVKLIKKAKYVVAYTRFATNTQGWIKCEKKSLLEFFYTLATENTNYPDTFSYSISEGRVLYLHCSL